MSKWVEDVALGALNEGVNQTTFLVLNVILFLAVLSLFALLFLCISASPSLVPHIAILLFIAICLWVSIFWLISSVGLVDVEDEDKSSGCAEEEDTRDCSDPAGTVSIKKEI
jgi:hypothetical protein